MKMIKKLLLGVACIAALGYADAFARARKGFSTTVTEPQVTMTGQTKNAEAVVSVEQEKLKDAIVAAEAIKTAATLAINKAKDQLNKKEISAVEASKIIGENNYKIEQAQLSLAQLTKESVNAVEATDAEQSYMSQLMTGAYNLGQHIIAPFKAGYGYTEQEKARARAIIAALEDQLNAIGLQYAAQIEAARGTEKTNLINEFDQIKQEFKNEIDQQKLITGDIMSTNRKLFWTTVGLAGAAMGGMLAKKYLGGEGEAATVEEPSFVERIKESIKNVPGGEEEQTEYFEKTYGPAATKMIQQTGQQVGESLGEAVRRMPSGEEAQTEYFEQTYGPTATETLQPMAQQAGEALSAAAQRIPSGEEAQNEYLEQTYGPAATEMIQQTGQRVGESLGEAVKRSPEQEGYFENENLDEFGLNEGTKSKAAQVGQNIQDWLSAKKAQVQDFFTPAAKVEETPVVEEPVVLAEAPQVEETPVVEEPVVPAEEPMIPAELPENTEE